MNKKLKIYCTTLVVIIIGTIVANTFSVTETTWRFSDEKHELKVCSLPEEFGYTEQCGDTTVIRNKTTLSVTVPVRRHNLAGDDVIISKVNNKTCMVEITEAKLSIPKDQVDFNTTTNWIIGLGVSINIILVAWLLFIIFRIIRSIFQQNVFVGKMSTNIETVGILLIAYECFQFILTYTITSLAQKHYALATYDIIFSASKTFDIKVVIFGLVMMIIAQIILMGKDLKEEQELTI